MHESIRATKGPKPKQHDEKRRCTHPGCITILSRYTPGPECRVHAPIKFGRVRGRS